MLAEIDKSPLIKCHFQVSVNVAKKTLFLFNIDDPDNPIELAFQPRYGTIVAYKWWVVCLNILCIFYMILELKLFLFYSLSSFSTFSFYVFVTLDSPISFLGCLYSLC